MAKRRKKKTSRRRRASASVESAAAPNEPAASKDKPHPDPTRQQVGHRFARTYVPPELYDAEKRKKWKLQGRDGRGPYVIELNLQHIGGLAGASGALRDLHALLPVGAKLPVRISRTYCGWWLSFEEWKLLLELDERTALEKAKSAKVTTDSVRYRAIYKLWPDFPVQTHVYRSLPTIKANAARLSFEAEGDGIVWAVIDSGIEGSHKHFAAHETLESPAVRDLHRSFVSATEELDDIPIEGQPLPDPDELNIPDEERDARLEARRKHALADDFGHGSHVAGIIAGAAPTGNKTEVRVLERVDQVDATGELKRGGANVGEFRDAKRVHGVAPRCKLVSLRVLDDKGGGRSSDVIRALEYVRERLNDNPKLLRVHGVNLSVGYEFDAEMFACGQSPICAEVNRLVQSGVVVVAAAGNTGYGTVASNTRPTKVGLSNTINDPGNAELAITVGSTHRDSPYMYGVSYFSSKGPTGDGRLKPDLVAPGERITSCGAGKRLTDAIESAGNPAKPPKGVSFAYYTEDSGTSMAAPHVSGAVAAFLSIRREFVGRPLDVKKIFTSTASPLGRERYFEGHGLVDLIRAIQSV
jgi:subtilisin family serine protease